MALFLLCAFLLLSPTVLSIEPCTFNCEFLLNTTTQHSPNTTVPTPTLSASNITIVFNNDAAPGTTISFLSSNQTLLALELKNETTVEVWGTESRNQSLGNQSAHEVIGRVNVSVAAAGRPDGRRYIEIKEVIDLDALIIDLEYVLLYHLINGVKYTYNNQSSDLSKMGLLYAKNMEVREAQNLYYVKSCGVLVDPRQSQPRICSMTTNPPSPVFNQPFTITAIVSGGPTGMQLSWTQQKSAGSPRYEIPSINLANDTDAEYPINSSIYISNFTEEFAGSYNCTILGQYPDLGIQSRLTDTQGVDFMRVVNLTQISRDSVNVTAHEVRNEALDTVNWGASKIVCEFSTMQPVLTNKSTTQYNCTTQSAVFGNRTIDCGYNITTFTLSNVELDPAGDGLCTVYSNGDMLVADGNSKFRVRFRLINPHTNIILIIVLVVGGVVAGGLCIGGCYVGYKWKRGGKKDEVKALL